MIRRSPASRSIRVFGVEGFNPSLLRRTSDLSRARLRRYRKEIEDLNDRQLLRRYMQYLRAADRAQHWKSFQRCLNSLGLFQQMLGRLYVAHKEVRDRDLEVPTRAEAYLMGREVEVRDGNFDVHEEAWDWSEERLEDELERVQDEMADDPESVALAQRWELLMAHLLHRRRQAGVDALQEDGSRVREEVLEVVRESVIHRLQNIIGYRFTRAEADHVLAGVGIEAGEDDGPAAPPPWNREGAS